MVRKNMKLLHVRISEKSIEKECMKMTSLILISCAMAIALIGVLPYQRANSDLLETGRV